MGCRNIGNGMKRVAEKVMEIYDRGEISCDVAKELIVTARRAVHCCDGDEDDVTDVIRMRRCGSCLKKRDEEENFYSIKDISGEEIRRDDIMSSDEELLASDVLCATCFDLVINRSFKDKSAGERERNYINQCRKESKKSR